MVIIMPSEFHCAEAKSVGSLHCTNDAKSKIEFFIWKLQMTTLWWLPSTTTMNMMFYECCVHTRCERNDTIYSTLCITFINTILVFVMIMIMIIIIYRTHRRPLRRFHIFVLVLAWILPNEIVPIERSTHCVLWCADKIIPVVASRALLSFNWMYSINLSRTHSHTHISTAVAATIQRSKNSFEIGECSYKIQWIFSAVEYQPEEMENVKMTHTYLHIVTAAYSSALPTSIHINEICLLVVVIVIQLFLLLSHSFQFI